MRCRYRTAAVCSLAWVFLAPFAGRADSIFVPTNLVTNDQTAHPAVITDASLVNAWGISSSGNSPFWVSDNGTGVSTLYAVNPGTNVPTKAGLTVTIPGAGNVTGQVFNTAAGMPAFNGDAFLFVSEDGTISGWRGALGTNAEILQSPDPGNSYKGVGLGSTGGHAYLYAANFHTGQIDVLKGDPAAPNLTGNFTDPSLPSGFAPFNIQNLNGTLYVTYAVRGPTGDDVPGPGHGIVDAFDLQGNLIGRIGTMGVLNSPWGLALAPAGFGQFAGDLLVGNFGDGLINAFAPGGGLVGTLPGDNAGNPLVIDGLWGLRFGSGAGSGGNSQLLYFSAGPDGESNGLFGSIAAQAVPEPGSFVLLLIGGLGLLGRSYWKGRKA